MAIIALMVLSLLIPLAAVATGPTIGLVIAAVGTATAGAEASAPIGTATMQADGTLILDLRAEGPGGAVGHSRLVYPPDHPDYRSVLDHIGALRPGESRPVPPWPERGR